MRLSTALWRLLLHCHCHLPAQHPQTAAVGGFASAVHKSCLSLPRSIPRSLFKPLSVHVRPCDALCCAVASCANLLLLLLLLYVLQCFGICKALNNVCECCKALLQIHYVSPQCSVIGVMHAWLHSSHKQLQLPVIPMHQHSAQLQALSRH